MASTALGVMLDASAVGVTAADDMLKLTVAAATPGACRRAFSMLFAHDAQLMPDTRHSIRRVLPPPPVDGCPRLPLSFSAEKPNDSMTAMEAAATEGFDEPGMRVNVAFDMLKLTFADSTPATLRNATSILFAHDAQLIP